MTRHSKEEGRDLRVPGSVGAAVRLGLAEIVQKLAASTPLSTVQAADHVQYELNILKEKWSANVSAARVDSRGDK